MLKWTTLEKKKNKLTWFFLSLFNLQIWSTLMKFKWDPSMMCIYDRTPLHIALRHFRRGNHRNNMYLYRPFWYFTDSILVVKILFPRHKMKHLKSKIIYCDNLKYKWQNHGWINTSDNVYIIVFHHMKNDIQTLRQYNNNKQNPTSVLTFQIDLLLFSVCLIFR